MKRNLLSITLLFLCNFLSINSFSQEWKALGPDDASVETGLGEGQASYLSSAISPEGVPYIAYADTDLGYKITVKRFVNNQWENVGPRGFTGRLTGKLSFVIDNNGVPFVAYTEGIPTTSQYGIYRTTVKKYTDGEWKNVGDFPYADGQAEEVAITIDKNNVPYVVYNVMPRGNDSRLIQMVHKYTNGNWQLINQRSPGNAALDHGIAVLSDGKVYVCYKDQRTGKATLANVTSQDWKVLGESSGVVYNVRMALDKNETPYILYMDINRNSKATVQKYTNGQLVTVGTAGFTSSFATALSIGIGPDNQPYIFSGGAVMKFDGESWKPFGTGQFSTKEVSSTFMSVGETQICIAYLTLKVVSSPSSDPWDIDMGMGSSTSYVYPFVKSYSFGPAAPQNLKADAGDAKVDLTWDNLSGSVSYKVYKGTSSANLTEFKTVTGTEYTDLEVENGTTYYYAVTAIDADNKESGKTAVKSVKPLRAPGLTSPADVFAVLANGTYTISDPHSNSTGAFSYTSSNTAVATVAGNVVTLLSTGETVITVSQAAFGTFSGGTATFKLTVTNEPNKAPTINTVSNQTVCIDAGEQHIALSNITAGPETQQTVGVSISTDRPELFSSLSISKGAGSDGLLSYQPAAGKTGEATITIKAKDDGGITNGGIDTYTTSFTLTISALPVASISADPGLSIAKGQTVKLTATGGTSYSWASANGILSGQNTSTLSIRPAQTTTYVVTVTNANGCSVTAQATVTVNPNKAPTVNTVPDQITCTGAGQQRIDLSNITAGPESQQAVGVSVNTNHPELFNSLSISKGAGSDGLLTYQPAAGVSGEAIVTIKVKDDGGTEIGGVDTYTTSFTLTISALPVASISTDLGLSISKGQTVKLTATGGASYSWASASGIISGQNTSVLTVRPDLTTTYVVTVTNANGCSVTKQVTITVKTDLEAVVVSNLMTPNGDGVNDNFMITNIDMFPTAMLKVYNSSGQLIYSKSNYDNSWNGHVNGNPLANGVYMYVVTFPGVTPALPALTGRLNVVN